MKINIANPATGAQKLIEIDDERKLRIFYDKRISTEVDAEPLGDEFKGYVLRITGGNDKQGFPMMQGVLIHHRVRLLLSAKHPCYRPRRKGERRRKSVRGCIVGPDIAVLNCIIVKQGPGPLPGLTDRDLPRRLGPKRASKIRKLFNLEKGDDVRKFVVRRTLPAKEGKKTQTKAPKIQRLVTPVTLQRRRRRRALKIRYAIKSREEAAEYAKLLATRRAETQAKRAALISKKRASSKRLSAKKAEGETAKPQATKKATAVAPKKTATKTADAPKKSSATASKKTTTKKTTSTTTQKKRQVKKGGKK